MTLALLLPWFPIVLAVGVAGRILGRTRGLALGILCALFWILIVQVCSADEIWRSPWHILSLFAGALSIVFMGRWSGEAFVVNERSPFQQANTDETAPLPSTTDAHHITSAIDQFGGWLEQHRNDADPWPKFDEFVRSLLYEHCNATHVRPFRLLATGEDLVPLRESDPLFDDERISARRGIIGHVVTTGRSYVDGLESQGDLVNQLAEDTEESIAWCFAVRRGSQRLGVVVVGQTSMVPGPCGDFARAMEKLINLFWCSVSEAQLSRSAAQVDPVSALHTRPAFLRVAEDALQSSFAQGEPVAVVVIALEGLRELNDSGRWEVADDLMHEVSDVLRRKIRLDDRIGRFDGSRIVLLLRRVDSELASLIVNQMMSRVSDVSADESRWASPITVRCGVTGSGTDQPTLRTLVSRALTQCRRARIEGVPIASDLGICAAVQVNGASA